MADDSRKTAAIEGYRKVGDFHPGHHQDGADEAA